MKAFLVWATLFLVISCGEQRPIYVGRGTTVSKRTSEPAPSVPVTNTDDATEPFNGRTRATAPELTAARDLYESQCSICHSPFDLSTKRSVTLARLTAAGVPMAVPLHMDLLRQQVWPKDLNDNKDDGIDTAKLGASALVEVLK